MEDLAQTTLQDKVIGYLKTFARNEIESRTDKIYTNAQRQQFLDEMTNYHVVTTSMNDNWKSISNQRLPDYKDAIRIEVQRKLKEDDIEVKIGNVPDRGTFFDIPPELRIFDQIASEMAKAKIGNPEILAQMGQTYNLA